MLNDMEKTCDSNKFLNVEYYEATVILKIIKYSQIPLIIRK